MGMQILSAIQNLSQMVLNEPDTEKVLHAVATEALRCTGANWSAIALVDEQVGKMLFRCTIGEGWPDNKKTFELVVTDASGKGITPFVAATGRPYLSGDVNRDSHYLPMSDRTQSELAVPVLDAHNRVRGVLNVERDKKNSFNDEHVQMLQSLASLVALHLQLNRYLKHQQALVKIGMSLPISADEESLLDQVMQVTEALLRFEASSIFLLDEATEQIVLRASRGDLLDKVNIARYSIGEGLTGWVVANFKSVRAENPQHDQRWEGRHLELPMEEIGAFLAVPILTRDRCVGVIRVLRRKSENRWLKNAFTEEDEEVLTAIAGQLGAGLEGIRMLGRLLRAERMAAWGELSAKAAHVLGNSAFAIGGDMNELMYLTNEPGDHTDQYRELALSLRRGITRLEGVLAEFRGFVMATQLNKEDVEITCLLRETMKEFYPKRSNVKLELNLCEDLPVIQADVTKLKRLFTELVENSLHFQEEGIIQISNELVPPEGVPENLALARGRSYVRIIVEDQGPGVPHERKKRIFNPFNSSRVKGMGLGLSIVKGIVDAHEGVIVEDGTPGEGARFVIYLPLRSNKNGRNNGNASNTRD